MFFNHKKELNRYQLLKKIQYDSIRVYSKKELKNLDFDYVLYDNNIVDVTDFINHHPGGEIQLIESLKQDITRYITGSVAINGNFTPHKHSFLTNRHILTKMTVGLLQEDHNLILDTREK